MAKNERAEDAKDAKMAHGKKPANQGSFGPVHTSPPKTSGVPGKGEAPKSTVKRGVKTPGIGGSKKSF